MFLVTALFPSIQKTCFCWIKCERRPKIYLNVLQSWKKCETPPGEMRIFPMSIFLYFFQRSSDANHPPDFILFILFHFMLFWALCCESVCVRQDFLWIVFLLCVCVCVIWCGSDFGLLSTIFGSIFYRCLKHTDPKEPKTGFWPRLYHSRILSFNFMFLHRPIHSSGHFEFFHIILGPFCIIFGHRQPFWGDFRTLWIISWTSWPS